MDFDIVAADALYNHTRVMKEPTNKKTDKRTKVNSYYSTYRTADNDIYKWKKELSLEKIRYVEENCVELMQTVGYTTYPEPLRKTKTTASKTLQIKTKGKT